MSSTTPSTTSGKARIVTLAAQRLRLMPVGRDAADKDVALIGDAYDDVIAELRRDGTASWGETVPDWAESSVAHLLAARVSGEYWVGTDREAFLQMGIVAYRTLTKFTADTEPSAEYVASPYF